jgi:hypothetical protein
MAELCPILTELRKAIWFCLTMEGLKKINASFTLQGRPGRSISLARTVRKVTTTQQLGEGNHGMHFRSCMAPFSTLTKSLVLLTKAVVVYPTNIGARRHVGIFRAQGPYLVLNLEAS